MSAAMRPREPGAPDRRPDGVFAAGVHGVAEHLPVSSSAHVALLRPGDRPFAVALHAGSAVALAWLWRREARAVPPVVHACALAPPVLVGGLAGGWLERRLGGRRATAAGLVAGSLPLLAPAGRRRARRAGWRDGLALGVAQAAALVPGTSRLGATLGAARLRGFAAPDAAVLARGVALPVTLGAAVRERPRAPGPAAVSLLATLAAAPVGRLAEGPLWPFALYRVGLALRTAS